MKKTFLYWLWGFFYLLCAFISNVESPSASQSVALTCLSLVFFIPPVILLVDAYKKKEEKTIRLLRLLAILSLSLTVLALIANIAAVGASDTWGTVLYQVLIFASVPMVCSQHYVLSMFLWACLLFATLPKVWKK
ncbi:MAG: hypothetical protein IKU07_09235 [Oscillospiraceae bacterium]|nr:hypothetical protein [Oscillospiraceae bacterium]